MRREEEEKKRREKGEQDIMQRLNSASWWQLQRIMSFSVLQGRTSTGGQLPAVTICQ
jgi:hypothetical protein